MKKHSTWLITTAVLGLVAILAIGCDDTTTDNHITVEPQSVHLIKGADPVLFSVVVNTNNPLFMPLEWSVADSTLGSIVENRGFTAIYGRTAKSGHNTIIVMDQGGREGLASVVQD